jgi:hypothetical protein
MFAKVPKPGFSFKGIHKRSISVLMAKVETPIEMFNLLATPCARTVHGALPVLLWTSNESPKPKTKRPKQRIALRDNDKSQR